MKGYSGDFLTLWRNAAISFLPQNSRCWRRGLSTSKNDTTHPWQLMHSWLLFNCSIFYVSLLYCRVNSCKQKLIYFKNSSAGVPIQVRTAGRQYIHLCRYFLPAEQHDHLSMCLHNGWGTMCKSNNTFANGDLSSHEVCIASSFHAITKQSGAPLRRGYRRCHYRVADW